MKPKVYVAGPYTIGDVAVNVRNAFEVADKILSLDLVPFVPHFTHFWHMLSPRDYNDWIKYDQEFIPLCSALYRISGESKGADLEVEIAKALPIPIFYNLDDLANHFKNR